jgi:O-antigen ligase
VATAALVLIGGVLPLATSPFASDSTMASWLLVATLGTALALLAPSRGAVPRPLAILLLIGVGVFVAAALAGATPLLSLVGRYPRYEGVVTIIGYALALVAGCRLLGPAAVASRRHFLSATAVAALLTAAVSVGQLVIDPGTRVIGLLGNSSILGGWAAVAFCLLGAHVIASTDDPRPLLIAGTVAAGGVLVVSAARASWLGTAVALVVAAVTMLLRRPRERWWLPLVGLGVLALAAWLLPTSQARLTGATPFASSTISGRLLLWQETWPLVAGHPVLGVGPSVFVDAIGEFHTPEWAAAVGPYAPPDSPHNVLLQVLSSTGLLGLAVVVAAVAFLVRRLCRQPGDAWGLGAAAAAAGVGVGYLFSFTDPATTTVAMFALGGAVASPSAAVLLSANLRRTRRAAVWVWTAACVALAGSALVAEARFSAALTPSPSPTLDIVAAADSRPWDPDLAMRIGSSVADLAASGAAEPSAAIPLATRGCAQLPASIACRLVLADLQTLAGDAPAAVVTLTDAEALDPNNVDRLLKLGIAQAESGSVEAAESSFQRAAELRPSAPEPWQNLAVLYRRAGRTADALAAERQADFLQKR